MNGDMLFVFGLLLVTIILFVSDRVRLDVVAVLVILVLMLSGLLTPGEALAGFGDPVVLLIAGLFVVGEGLYRTGVAIAASTAFATPVASPVNTLVLGPGGYRFNDFVKVGVPLQVLAMIVTLLMVPVLFPL